MPQNKYAQPLSSQDKKRLDDKSERERMAREESDQIKLIVATLGKTALGDSVPNSVVDIHKPSEGRNLEATRAHAFLMSQVSSGVAFIDKLAQAVEAKYPDEYTDTLDQLKVNAQKYVPSEKAKIAQGNCDGKPQQKRVQTDGHALATAGISAHEQQAGFRSSSF